MRRMVVLAPLIVATYMPLPFCSAAVRPTAPPDVARQRLGELWHDPHDIASADLYNGPWGRKFAPDPNATYTFVREKTEGISPGMTVRGPDGETWSVKQGEEAPIEVVLSRVLSALGYHQPPVYFLPGFAVDRGSWGVERAQAGRFRPHEKALKERGSWSWQENPFVGTKPYQGLLVTLMLFDSSDLKNSNNSIYDLKEPREGAARWYVVRDLGTALGETGRLDPKRGDPDLFARQRFIERVKEGYVEFGYHGYHQELYHDRITPSDVKWACDRLSQLTDAQWRDAFRAGGYDPSVAGRFIAALKSRIAEGERLLTASE